MAPLNKDLLIIKTLNKILSWVFRIIIKSKMHIIKYLDKEVNLKGYKWKRKLILINKETIRLKNKKLMLNYNSQDHYVMII